METKFNFKSQIATSRVQSERLLSLGLKKETADMHWAYHSVTATRYIVAHPCDGVGECIPAWSMHRLIELLSTSMFPYRVIDNDFPLYDCLIARIEWQIEEGYFNKEYLEE